MNKYQKTFFDNHRQIEYEMLHVRATRATPCSTRIEEKDDSAETYNPFHDKRHSTHRNFWYDLNRMEGECGRLLTSLSSFSPFMIEYKSFSHSLCTDETLTSQSAVTKFIQLYQSEIRVDTIPEHWKTDITGKCKICNIHIVNHVMYTIMYSTVWSR